MSINFNQATFMKGAMKASQFPADNGAEVAFIGRSNCGKSSAINAITGIGNLARKSKTPGRTREINFFTLDATEEMRLVDLPGYGFAKVTEEMKQKWNEAINDYFQQRRSLVGLVVLMDIRHPLTSLDINMIDWATEQNLQTLVLLTKADKLGRNQQNQTLFKLQKDPVLNNDLIKLQLFSATKSQGVDEVQVILSQWLD